MTVRNKDWRRSPHITESPTGRLKSPYVYMGDYKIGKFAPSEPFRATNFENIEARILQHVVDRKTEPMPPEEYDDFPSDITPETHPDHWVVGHEFGGHDWQDPDWRGKRWFCYSHDAAGYNMYATDGSGHWTNV